MNSDRYGRLRERPRVHLLSCRHSEAVRSRRRRIRARVELCAGNEATTERACQFIAVIAAMARIVLPVGDLLRWASLIRGLPIDGDKHKHIDAGHPADWYHAALRPAPFQVGYLGKFLGNLTSTFTCPTGVTVSTGASGALRGKAVLISNSHSEA